LILNARISIPSNDKDFNDEFIFFSRPAVQEKVGLSSGGFLLFTLLAGGDYNCGVEGCGAITALGLVKCGFGDTLLEALINRKHGDWSDAAWDSFLIQWRAGIRHELANNWSGMLHSCQAKLALVFPETFPTPNIIQLYFAPLVSESFPNSPTWYELCEPMIFHIAKFCLDKFHWNTEKAKQKFTASLWDGVFLRLLYFVGLFLSFDCEGI
jgi:Holliday junction resolvase YEN1